MQLQSNNKKRKISLEDLGKKYRIDDYIELAGQIKILLETKKLTPIKVAGVNGKKPALYNMYWMVNQEEIGEDRKEELLYQIHSRLNLDFYQKNLLKYEEDREAILKLSKYIRDIQKEQMEFLSVNEKSFEIWQREKYLDREGGRQLLKNLGLELESLHIYETREPLAYYSNHKNTPQSILIIENKDTFYSMRKHLLKGSQTILGVPIGTLLYGRGKGVIRAFYDFDLCAEPYMLESQNTFLYFGDIDYEGIKIYEGFYTKFHSKYLINPFIQGYKHMLKKGGTLSLPNTKEKQNQNIDRIFLDALDLEMQEEMQKVLQSGEYIPQEILNITDF